MHAGDMFPWKDAPFIDRSNGGSGVEWPRTLAKLLGGVKNVDTVIGGHQPVATWKDSASSSGSPRICGADRGGAQGRQDAWTRRGRQASMSKYPATSRRG